jgi:Branched-chain amino acid transport system / permease component
VTAPATSERRFDAIAWLRTYGTTLFLALLMVFFASQNQRFISLRNLTNILTEGSIYGIIAVGMTFVILTAGVDLSVGSLLAFAGMAGASAVRLIGGNFPPSWVIALSMALCAGAAAGYLQGKAITRLGIPPFIVTLGGMTVWRGATLILHDGAPISGFDSAYRWWGTGTIAQLPVPVALFTLVAAAGYIVQRYTRYGRHVYAVGDQRVLDRGSFVRARRIPAVRQTRRRRSDGRGRLRTARHRLGRHWRSEPVGWARRHRRDHHRRAAHRRAHQWAGRHACFLVLAASHHRSDHRGRRGLRQLREVAALNAKGDFANPSAFNERVKLLWLGVGTAEPEMFRADIGAAAQALKQAGVRVVYFESNGTAHEWQTWRRDLNDFAPRLLR